MATRHEALKVLQEGTAHLKSMANMDPESISDVAVEAMSHLIEHFIQKPGTHFDSDFVLILFNAYMGSSKKTLNEDILGTGIYMVGNENYGAHQLAAMMRIDPAICRLVIHAIHAYNSGATPP